MSEYFQPQIDRPGIALTASMAAVFGVAGLTSETLIQGDLLEKIQAARIAHESISLAVQNSNYGMISRAIGENFANIVTNQLGDLAVIPFTMLALRAFFGTLGVDGNPDNPNIMSDFIDVLDATALGASTYYMLNEFKDIYFPNCTNLSNGCVGDYQDLLAFSVPLISLAIYRRRGIALALGHIFQSLNPFDQGRVGVEKTS